jgi:hypothetical protein
MRTLPTGSRNIVELARSTYNFRDGSTEYSYVMLDGESYAQADTEQDVSLVLYYGTYAEWFYTESTKTINTAYASLLLCIVCVEWD